MQWRFNQDERRGKTKTIRIREKNWNICIKERKSREIEKR